MTLIEQTEKLEELTQKNLRKRVRRKNQILSIQAGYTELTLAILLN